MTLSSSDTILIIGYGNSLRSDDGAGIRVIQAIQQKPWPGVRSLSVHQLTPELAAEIAIASAVIFVDAALSEFIEVRSLVPNLEGIKLGHHSNPEVLLALTLSLYERVPPAWGIFIPGINFEFGEELSPKAQEGVKLALERIQTIVNLLVLLLTIEPP
ncbi:hydrogenase maturation protease [Aphanothece sacrum]|uniref:Hydrogenase maturation protease n=1 Tax=Aphanothece sacrum FPU1 TaxID=1920663 RepID=A0A401INA3_APHSA|nr:hydrogenase maturation protease [Aphanothece sacrum]GBF82721.1 hydrogenase maturation protease [Aphanothece sacrum FPU1]GBF84488.1 hydrogenase maturation protease [Aphanothece sacrum FPU3]